MSMNQPPSQSPLGEGGGNAGGTPAASPHGASAAPPPYGRPPGDYSGQGAGGGNADPAAGQAWNQQNQQPQPGYRAPGQQSYPQGPPAGGPAPAGPPQGYYYAVNPPKSRLAAGLLGIFLGGFGIHRFYLGYTTIGVVQILVTVFTWGFGAVWGFVEGFMILAAAQTFRTDARGVPLRD